MSLLDIVRHRPARHYTVEPDVAAEMIVNLLRKHQRFALTQEERTDHMRDVVTITIGSTLTERKENEEYAKSMTCETLDDAVHFALNCLGCKLCFAVFCTESRTTEHFGMRYQWVFTAERNKAIRERRNSREFG